MQKLNIDGEDVKVTGPWNVGQIQHPKHSYAIPQKHLWSKFGWSST